MSTKTNQAYVEERLSRQNQYLAALHDVTLGLIENLDPDRLIEAIMERAIELAGTPHGFVDIADPQRGELKLRVAKGNFAPHLGVWTKPNEGVSGRAFFLGETQISEDYNQFTGKLPGYEWLRSLVCVPMRWGPTVIGVIGLGFDSVVGISSDYTEILNQFGHLASLTLHNAQLYDAAQQEISQRERAERELTKYQDHLEELVSARTAELTAANLRLQQEIGERLRAESALRQSEEKYRQLIENAPVGIIATDRDGQLLSVNPIGLGMLNAPTLDAARQINLLTHPNLVRAGIAADLQYSLNYETPVAGEHHFRKVSTGREAVLRYQCAPIINSEGKVIGLQILFEDVTERKELERAQAIAYQRLHELNHLKDEFIAGVSHELRTPITNLKLYHHLLDKMPENVHAYLESLNEQTDRLERVVEGILYLSEVKDELKNRMFRRIDLRDLVGATLGDYSRSAAASGLVVRFDAADPQFVDGDPVLLRRVMSVLLDNSLNYTPPNGTVQVEMLSRSYEGQNWTGFAISNTGPMIPSDEIPRLFDRFFRGKAALDSGTPGAGVGLAIAKEIIDTHHGQIEVINSDGPEGRTIFYVWLPACTEDEQSPLTSL